jgi:hypothetical protein
VDQAVARALVGPKVISASARSRHLRSAPRNCRRDLLTNRQYNQYSVTFDPSALIRSDVQSQHASLAIGIQAGFYSQNDARRPV